MKKNSVKSPIQKRSFLLFELLVSLTLISMLLFPLIKVHATLRKLEADALVEIQIDRLMQEAFCKIKEKLYENQISWNSLKSGEEVVMQISLISGKNQFKTIPCLCHLSELDFCNKPSNNKASVLLRLSFTIPHYAKSFERTLYVEKSEHR